MIEDKSNDNILNRMVEVQNLCSDILIEYLKLKHQNDNLKREIEHLKYMNNI